MDDTDRSKIFGIIPKDKYTKITYYFILFWAGLGLLLGLLGLAGIYPGLGGLANVAGVIGLLMALLGFAVVPQLLSALDRNHCGYICILFLVFFILGAIVNAMGPGLIIAVLYVAVMAAQALLVFAGYNAFRHGRTITRESLGGEVNLALNRR